MSTIKFTFLDSFLWNYKELTHFPVLFVPCEFIEKYSKVGTFLITSVTENWCTCSDWINNILLNKTLFTKK